MSFYAVSFWYKEQTVYVKTGWHLNLKQSYPDLNPLYLEAKRDHVKSTNVTKAEESWL